MAELSSYFKDSPPLSLLSHSGFKYFFFFHLTLIVFALLTLAHVSAYKIDFVTTASVSNASFCTAAYTKFYDCFRCRKLI